MMLSALIPRLVPGVLLLGLAACSTQPPQFHTLVPPPSASAAHTGAPTLLIELMPVQVPAQVDIPELVLRQGSGRLVLAESQQWAAPLGSELRDALLARLRPELGAEDVYGASPAPGLLLYRLRVDVRRFDSLPGQEARLEASWSVEERARDGTSLTCGFAQAEPVGPGYEALVEGHQIAVAALAAQMAAGVRALRSGHPACP